MDHRAADETTKAFIRAITQALREADGFATAALRLADDGNIDGAVKIILNIEDPAYRVERMLKAALLIRHELVGQVTD